MDDLFPGFGNVQYICQLDLMFIFAKYLHLVLNFKIQMVRNAQDIEAFIRQRETVLRSTFNLKTLVLFGSFASGTHSDDSDIDLLYTLGERKAYSFREYMNLLLFLEEGLGRKVDLILFENLNPVIKSEKSLPKKSLL
jgi:predicted nucleotidyltransferase